jgi:uncharacterized protein (TIGR02996 family)
MLATTEDAFFADIREHPDDDVPRLVYADWLDEYGDDRDRDRADLIRVQCRLARVPPGDPARHALARREQHLRDRLDRSWFLPLHSLADNWELRRGFVDSLVVQAPQLIEHGDTIVRLAPVAELAVVFQRPALARLVACPHLAHVQRLEAHGGMVRDDGARLLGGCPYLGGLEALVLHGCGITKAGLAALLELDLSRLRALNLGANNLYDSGMERLCAAAGLARLERLSLGANDLRRRGVRALVAARHLRHLVNVNLGANYLDDTAIELLAGAAHLASLRRLDVRNNAFQLAGARALARSRRLAGLEFLNAGGNGLSAEARDVLRARFGERVQL